jgi:hypothetical protein
VLRLLRRSYLFVQEIPGKGHNLLGGDPFLVVVVLPDRHLPGVGVHYPDLDSTSLLDASQQSEFLSDLILNISYCYHNLHTYLLLSQRKLLLIIPGVLNRRIAEKN